MQTHIAASLIVVLGLGCAGGTAPRVRAVDAAAAPANPGDGPAPDEPAAASPDAAGGGAAPYPDAAASPSDAPASPPGASGQGPVAQGQIVFSQDFETSMDGITRSPTDLPAERAQLADDPLGQRGKVMKIVWQAGDRFMTNGGSTHTRSFISNTGYSFPLGTTVEYAWGYMTSSLQIDAAFAQQIRPGGPMWLIEGNGDGTIYVNCRSCGGKANLDVKLMPNRWYDIRVEMTYANGGPVRFFIDGVKVLERKMSLSDPPGQRAHWDGGIYNHAAGTTTRTVYISNLSVATK
jgi:hypothetical protein